MTTQITLPPTYQELLKEMGKQLSLRKSVLMKRVLLISWPLLLLVVIGYIVDKTVNIQTADPTLIVYGVIAFAVYICCTVIYSTIVSFIFTIEKHIWVDSYFDKKDLSTDASWSIAKKLFWDGVKFRLTIWWRYYLLPLVTILAFLTIFGVYTFSTSAYEGDTLFVFMGSFVLMIIGFALYSYFVRVKLRYSWFIFLDSAGSNYSFPSLIEQMKKLNSVSKSETFKKSLVTNIGTDSVQILIRGVTSSIQLGLSAFGGAAGKMIGNMVKIYGDELGRQVTDFANISAQYILYRFARKQIDGQEQVVNEYLYDLARK